MTQTFRRTILSQDTSLSDPASTVRSDANFVHDQLAPATIWNISHNLNKYPSVTVVDSGGNVVVGDVVYISPGVLRVEFSVAFGGRCYLN